MADDSHRKLQASEIGLRAPRGCTNLPCILLFLAAWALMIFTAISAYKLGDLNRLIYGTDYLGNVCAHGDGNVSLPSGTAVDWGARSLLWYPVTYTNGKLLIVESRKYALCVSRCPTTADVLVEIYNQKGALPASAFPYYYVLFNSTEKFHRCVPEPRSFLCALDSDGCNTARSNSTIDLAGIYDGLTSGFAALKERYWVVLACTPIAIVVCFIWMFILRRLVKPMVIATAIALLVLLIGGGFLMYQQSGDSDYGDYYKYGSFAVWGVAFLVLCVMVFLRKDVMVACDIIEEASKIPIQIPSMLIVPVVVTLLIVPFAVFFLFTSAVIYTAAQTVSVDVLLPQFSNGNSTAHYVQTQTREFQFEHWRVVAEIYNLLIFLWSVGFVNAIGFMTLAFCAVFWYWSNPGDNKTPEAGAAKAASLTLRNHLGSLALGSLIIALIQLVRLCIKVFERQLERHAKSSACCRCCICCAECCLACFNRVVKFISKNSYIMTAMTGEPFLDSARHALSLLVRNAISVGAVSVVGEWVCLVGKILITALVCVVAWAMQRGSGGDESGSNSNSNLILVLVVVGLVAYFISAVFINTFHVCIDTVLLSYCYDLEAHDGGSKPYYFPSDLAKHVDRARGRVEATQAESSSKKGDLDRPLETKV